MKTTRAATHGAGGAHIRWMMFGARGPLLAPEPEGSAGGAGGEGTGDPGAGGANGSPTTPPQGGAGGEKVFTQAELDRIVAQRLERERAKQKPTGSTSAPSSGARTEPSNTDHKAGSSPDVMAVLEMQDTINALADERGVRPNAAQLRRIRQDYMANSSSISDLNAWGGQWFDDMGLRKSDTSTPNNNPGGDPSKTAPPKPGAPVTTPPISDKGPAHGAPREFDSISDPNDITEGDIERLVAKHGEDKANELIAQKVRNWLPTVRIKLGPERPER